jgi:rRNA processing protein Krr1/Pno1
VFIIAVCEIIDISKIYSLKKRLVERIKQQAITNEIMHGFG